MAKSNRVREDRTEEAAPKRKRSKQRSTGDGRFARFKAFWTDERTHKVFGMFLILAAAYLVVAFTSFLFTWRIDQDLVGRSLGEIFSPEVRVENWLGKIGALTAHQFIYKWFGIAAFALPLWSFLAGIRILLGTWLLPPKRTLGWTAMALFWMPALLGFAFRGDLVFLGGGIGHSITTHLTTLLGNIGTGALIFFAASAFAVFTFNLSFGWLQRGLDRMKTTEAEQGPEAEVEEAVAEPAVTGVRLRTVAEAEEELAEGPETTVVEEIEEAEAEEPEVAELELEAAPFEVMEPVTSPVVSSLEELTGDLNGMDVSAGEEDAVLSEDQIEDRLKEFGEYDPKLDLSNYELPPIDLMVDHGTGELTVTKEELEANKDRIVETLGHYNIGI
ncbi:MAG: DNA translocase FtsK 4TM domain-containing protein, partial [Flavobacteriales bacterium]|nr:DNA translocase FtsK 4TM domain-containing protein [Flavobacteriales bacterium]